MANALYSRIQTVSFMKIMSYPKGGNKQKDKIL